MFIDRVQINIKGGDGGNGAVSFYRAKYVPNGGPDGGDGGRGGDVVFVTSEHVATLADFRYKRHFKAERGMDGGKDNCSGKGGEDCVIVVPVGTVIKEAESGKVMADLNKPDMRRVLISGGRGGRGNQHFATATRQAPRYAQPGKKSREYDIILELKLIADVGIIGLPNAGKSTLLSMVTNATPKIGNYHFTTLAPNLGVFRQRDGSGFVLADIPGLIEGASEGLGLGHDFLRHVERTKVLIHVVDAAATEGLEPVNAIEIINKELAAYNPEIMKRPMIIAANKTDVPDYELYQEELESYCKEHGYPLYFISAASNQGLSELLSAAADILKDYPADITFNEDYEEYNEVTPEYQPFTITVPEHRLFVVEGAGIDRMLGYTAMDTEAGFAFFQRYLREKGIIDALKERGVNEGDTVVVGGMEFDYFE